MTKPLSCRNNDLDNAVSWCVSEMGETLYQNRTYFEFSISVFFDFMAKIS